MSSILNDLNTDSASSALSKPHTCRNCGHIGHLYKDCPHPITSFGIICYRINPENKELEYLMIQRKDSLCFMEFIRGKYTLDNEAYILQILEMMTVKEKNDIKTIRNYDIQIDTSNPNIREFKDFIPLENKSSKVTYFTIFSNLLIFMFSKNVYSFFKRVNFPIS